MHSKKVRQILDQGGLQDVRIFTSGNLDEYALAEFVEAKAPIDGFGVGTRMVTSSDAPYLDCAYKLVEYAGIGRRKRSEGKATWPGRKQVYRHFNQQGEMKHDVLTVEDDSTAGRPLIEQVMAEGQCLAELPTLKESREYALAELAALPASLKTIKERIEYQVDVSESLKKLAAEIDSRPTG